jgi:outer membrane assembly lipoprotein YfiO
MPSFRISHAARAGALLATVACSRGFKIGVYKSNESLYAAGLKQFQARKWDNAIMVFDKLTLELSARDSLLPRAYFYLATAHDRKGEHLLAAQGFTRLSETFPDDTLAAGALFQAGKSYQKMWRKPQLDPTYGQTAIATLRTLPELYPATPYVDSANAAIGLLNEWFATKDYDTGMHYLRRKAYDSAIIYFKDVTKNYPTTDRSRQAFLRLVDAYRAIRYRDDVKDVCTTLHKTYPQDREVQRLCGPAPPPTVARPTP